MTCLKPLKIALVHRDHPRQMAGRIIGMWSYPVPELEVTVIPKSKFETLIREDFSEFDAVFWEDARTDYKVEGDLPVPVVYYVGDSTLSIGHLRHRHKQSRLADLILIDWDRLEQFEHGDVPVKRLSYCVNNRLFYPREKTVDVGFYVHMTPERRDLHRWLTEFCKLRGYNYDGGTRIDDYCGPIGSAKVNINLNRNPETRAHRCYDVMASRSCLLTSPMPEVSEEDWIEGYHYISWTDWHDLAIAIDAALKRDWWSTIAWRGFNYVQDHTWAARAKQLHALLTEFITEGLGHATVY